MRNESRASMSSKGESAAQVIGSNDEGVTIFFFPFLSVVELVVKHPYRRVN